GVVEILEVEEVRSALSARYLQVVRSSAGRDQEGVVRQLAPVVQRDGLADVIDVGDTSFEHQLDAALRVLLDGSEEHFLTSGLALDVWRQRHPVVERPALVAKECDLAVRIVL